MCPLTPHVHHPQQHSDRVPSSTRVWMSRAGEGGGEGNTELELQTLSSPEPAFLQATVSHRGESLGSLSPMPGASFRVLVSFPIINPGEGPLLGPSGHSGSQLFSADLRGGKRVPVGLQLCRQPLPWGTNAHAQPAGLSGEVRKYQAASHWPFDSRTRGFAMLLTCDFLLKPPIKRCRHDFSPGVEGRGAGAGWGHNGPGH